MLAGSTERYSDSEVKEVEELLDALFLDLKKQALPLSKESLLDSYSDLIIENVEADPRIRLPNLSIADIEQIIDEAYDARFKGKSETKS